jgi:hypothetical protein
LLKLTYATVSQAFTHQNSNQQGNSLLLTSEALFHLN